MEAINYMLNPSPIQMPNRIIEANADDEGGITFNDNSVETLRNIFANSHINILLGSGFSAVSLPTLGNREKWFEWCDYYDWDSPDEALAAKALLQLEYFKNVLLPMESIEPTEEMVGFARNLQRILGTRGTTTIPKRANIFTTNYDPMVELAMEKAGCYYNDGFEGRANPVFSTRSFSRTLMQQSLAMEYSAQVPTINLVKLHGSVTWGRRTPSWEISYHSHQKFLDRFKKRHTSLLGNDVLGIVESLLEGEPEAAEDEMVQEVEALSPDETEQLSKFLSEYQRVFCIINPTKQKFEETVMGLTYYELLRLYANELDRNNTLLISFGFSFDDEHILEITKRALENPQLILVVCCHTEEELLSRQVKFLDCNNVWYVVPKNTKFELPALCSMLGEVR